MKRIKSLSLIALIAAMILSVIGPISNAGVASAAGPSQSLIDRMNSVYNALSDEDKDKIREARDRASGLASGTLQGNDGKYLLDEIWTKVHAVDSGDTIKQKDLVKVISNLGITYFPDGSSLDTALTEIKPTLDQLAILAGIPDASEGINWTDIEEYFNLVESETKDLLSDMSLTDFLDLLEDSSGMLDLARQAVEKLLDENANANKLLQVIKNFGITPNDIKASVKRVLDVVDPGKEASKALMFGYFKSQINPGGGSDNEDPGEDTSDPGNGGGGPGGPVAGPTAPAEMPAPQEAADKAKEKLQELFQDGKPGNSNSDKKAAQKAVENAVKEAAKVNVSSNVTVDNGVAKLNVPAEQVAESFKQVKQIAEAANNALKEADPNAEPIRVVATLEIGTVAQDKVEVNLPKELLEAAKNEGIDAIAVSVNGLIMEIDVNQFSQGTVMQITKEDSAVADSVTSGKRASDVYNFEFTDGNGQPLNNFDEPVRISIPVNTAGIEDPNYLVFVKLENGQVIPYGGNYNSETGTYEVERRSFSTYTVIENRVNFDDIDSVESWAGKAIRIAAAKGIINGRAAGTFVPEGNITRAEFATLLVKTFGLEGNFTEKFNDVQDGDWYQPYIAAAAHYGIVNGRSATQFDPNALITRSELAAMSANALTKIMKYKGLNNADAALAKFKDAGDIPAGLKAGVALLTQEGIISGMTPDTFEPNGNATRAQAAVIIYKLFQLI